MSDGTLQKEPATLPASDIFEQKILWLYGVAFVLFLFFYAIRPIDDPDFWWHLKSGEVMAQSRGLLSSDPFSFAGDGVVSTREALILKGYWLWQITAYGFYALFGFNGIFLLNLLVIGGLAGVAIQQLSRQQVGCLLSVLLLTLGFCLFRNIYPLERPQIISFLLAAILMGFIARVRDGGELGWTLPLLMLCWANLHGGFVVGDLILVCFAAGAIIEYRRDLPRLRRLLLWALAGLGASLLNPNGAMVFSELFTFHNSALMTGTSEYQSSWTQFQGGSRIIITLWILVALYGIGLWNTRRLYWPELLAGLFLAGFSLAYMRNVGFFAVAMLPAIGFYLQQGKLLQPGAISPGYKYLFVIIATAVLVWQTSAHWPDWRKEWPVSTVLPRESTEFILSSGLQGRMLNTYDSGGYLLWKLYPQHRVFIDGRGLDTDVYRDWKAMTSASLQEVGGRKEFEVLLDRFGIDYVVQPLIHPGSGRLIPLLKFLLIKPEWIPVYVDQQSYILVRNSQINSAVIASYQMSKIDFINKMIDYLLLRSNKWPAVVKYHVGLADMFIYVDRNAEAQERLAVIERLQPDNPVLPWLRSQLDAQKR